jgi:hypothetical protein
MITTLKKFRLFPGFMVFLGFSLCLTLTSTLDSTQAEPALSAQYLSSPEMKNLLRDQKLDLKVFIHLQKLEFKGFRASQEVQLKEWESHERKDRHKFFSEHGAGTERRSYVQSFMKRREDLLKQISADKAQKILEQNAKFKSFHDAQEEKVKKLSEKLRDEQSTKNAKKSSEKPKK